MEPEKKFLESSEKSFLQPVLTINEFSDGYEKYTVHTTKRSTAKQVLLGLIANFTCIAPSMSLGFSAIVLPYLLDEKNVHRLTPGQGSWVASVASIATPLGSFLSGPLSEKFGRKMTFIWVHLICSVGWFVIAAAYYIPQYQYSILIVGRLITGLSTGIASMPPAVYSAEISSPTLRGMFTTWGCIFFSVGVLIIYLLGYVNQGNWFLTSIISGSIPLFGIFLVHVFILESPTWLISQGKCNMAKKNMCSLYSTKTCTPQVQEEINTIICSKRRSEEEMDAHTSRPNKLAAFNYYTGPTCFKPFVLMLIFFFFQQFTGTFVIVFYAIDIIEQAGVEMNKFAAAVIIAIVRFVASVLIAIISKSFGRRPPSIISGAGMAISMIMLGFYVMLKSKNTLNPILLEQSSWLPMFLLGVYIFTASLGFYTIPFAMTPELFPARVRGMACGILTCIAYTFNFVAVKMYPGVKDAIGIHGVFFIFGAVSLFGTLFVIIFLPETRGKTLEEIEEYFGGNRNKNNTEQEKNKLSMVITYAEKV